ncbi:hypothetical protein C723_0955 [Christiangramia flava JLT2011]|uniref:Uncharacterized protein n=1 Tax=Christiangramia flava JLT2011 TaxID=1229726 RepID=A0A1L7I241_9FLAO|nr:hypothetical protein GRFL_0529 [Christiangramia flava JLT2011]OSS39838.1 hypothetical protein C723_0955 [Christiangramia flava JLT2011]
MNSSADILAFERILNCLPEVWPIFRNLFFVHLLLSPEMEASVLLKKMTLF